MAKNGTSAGHKGHGSEDEGRWRQSQRAADIAKALEKLLPPDPK
jgi:hypothetical protein